MTGIAWRPSDAGMAESLGSRVGGVEMFLVESEGCRVEGSDE